MKREKLEILQKPQRGRKDSFWFDGAVAIWGKYRLIANGDIRVKIGDEDLRNGRAVEYALRKRLYDRHIRHLEFDNNNWFEVVSEDGQCSECDVAGTYDEAIDLLKWYRKEKIYG